MRPKEDHQAVSFLTQSIFRILLNAMSRPGKIYEIHPVVCKCNSFPLGRFGSESALLAPLLTTLLDREVSFYVTGNNEPFDAIAEFTGAHISVVRDADFVLVPYGEESKVILEAKRGTLRYPDESATIIFCVERLCGEIEDCPWVRLKGPGIADTQRLSITGIDPEAFAHLMVINSAFPLGVDSFFIDKEGRLAAVPRSTAIEEVKKWAT